MGASSQSESNENPITAYEKRKDFSFFRTLSEAFGDVFFSSLQLQSRPRRKTYLLFFNLGGAFTIVHSTLTQVATNQSNIEYVAFVPLGLSF